MADENCDDEDRAIAIAEEYASGVMLVVRCSTMLFIPIERAVLVQIFLSTQKIHQRGATCTDDTVNTVRLYIYHDTTHKIWGRIDDCTSANTSGAYAPSSRSTAHRLTLDNTHVEKSHEHSVNAQPIHFTPIRHVQTLRPPRQPHTPTPAHPKKYFRRCAFDKNVFFENASAETSEHDETLYDTPQYRHDNTQKVWGRSDQSLVPVNRKDRTPKFFCVRHENSKP